MTIIPLEVVGAAKKLCPTTTSISIQFAVGGESLKAARDIMAKGRILVNKQAEAGNE